MRGMVRMGVLSITLCCCILTLCSCSVTSCSVSIAGGSTICLILFWRILMRRCTLGILFAVAVSSASSSVRAQKCWWGVKLGNWQCCRKSSVDPECNTPWFQGCNRGPIGSGPLMGQGTTHQCPVMPMILWYHHLCIRRLCTLGVQEDINSSHTGCSVPCMPICLG